jgi:hypothetical protein
MSRDEMTPLQFEQCVKDWISESLLDYAPRTLEISHLGAIAGRTGNYKIDVLVKIKIFGEALVTLLVECKHQKRPVERDVVQILEAKLRDTRAHKGALFSTSGFQAGALEYAKDHGIAAVEFSLADLKNKKKRFCPKFLTPNIHSIDEIDPLDLKSRLEFQKQEYFAKLESRQAAERNKDAASILKSLGFPGGGS